MSITMNKELLIRVPMSLYQRTRLLCESEYKSISALIRELLLERLDDSLTHSERTSIKKSRRAFRAGKGIDWRSVRHG